MLHNFELDPKIIHHIIFSQAGSVGKAIIELIMNSIDAGASRVDVTLTETGFKCADDGNGFASLDDVKRYFGRFGTPHAEGDATYGRFRLGRGQIMAHASTQWSSNFWRMNVDTPRWGYQYDLHEETNVVKGCAIKGQWYEALSHIELLSTEQEIRDLIRYTSIQVFLNGSLLNKNPSEEKWDYEDENAYYRVKTEGAVFIYNQGVLVRPDSSHIWGVGGIIVTKKAIDLNVSRTDILRKTCKVWKACAQIFKKLAEKHNAQLGERRKTEARREKAAHDLLSGAVEDKELERLWREEETITILPGKKHISLSRFWSLCYNREHGNKATIVMSGRDIPKGESIAHAGLTVVVHPGTLSRFGCHSVSDFKDALARIGKNLTRTEGGRLDRYKLLTDIQFMDFDIIKEAFKEHTKAVVLKSLDADTRRLWTALAWCLRQYAALCMDQQVTNRVRYMRVIVGESNTAEAWTDGLTYIAINKKIVDKLKSSPMKTASYIFSLIEHEVAHEGDSIDAGHDEAFYQRFHEISLNNSEERQRYMHLFIRKYSYSIEQSGKRLKGETWNEQYLLEKAGSGREKVGLPNAFLDGEIVSADLSDSEHDHEDKSFLDNLNKKYRTDSDNFEPNWKHIFETAVKSQFLIDKAAKKEEEEYAEFVKEMEAEFLRNLKRLNIPEPIDADLLSELDKNLEFFMVQASDQEIFDALTIPGAIQAIINRHYQSYDDYFEEMAEIQSGIDSEMESFFIEQERKRAEQQKDPNYKDYAAKELQHLIRDGETWWSLQRNAAASGFWRIEDYLKSRSDD